MALSDDQRAMLRLLAQREQGYEDIAALMGLSVDDVRAKVKDALAQLENEGAAAPPLPPEPPAAPAPEPPVAAPPPAPAPPAPTPTPASDPPPAQQAAAAATPPPASPSQPSAPKKPRDRNQLIAIGGGVLALVVIVVLAVLLISGSDGDSSPDGTTAAAGSDTTSQTTANGGEEPDPTMAVLKAVAGQSGSGTAIFGNFEESLVLAVKATGLEPTSAGTQYAIAIAASPTRILPIATTAVGAKGQIEASVKLPAELLLFLANETYSEIVITRANTARLKAEIKKESKEPAYTGVPVLRGKITGSLIGNEAILRQVEEEKASEESE